MLEELLPSVSVTDLMPGTLHEYRVRAKNDSGTGAWSEEYSYWTIPDVANKVSSSASETHIEITWDNVIGATGYDIEVDGEILEDQVSPYAYMALESGTRHTFRIRAKIPVVSDTGMKHLRFGHFPEGSRVLKFKAFRMR